MKACVFSFVDHTHSAAAELLQNAVVRDGGVDHFEGESYVDGKGQVNDDEQVGRSAGGQLALNRHYACAVKRRWSTAGESPARELGSLHPEAIGAGAEETKPSEPPV